MFSKFRGIIKGAALSVALFAFIPNLDAQVSFGETIKFNDGWLFSLQDIPDANRPEYADTAWRALNLPHDWSIEGTYSPALASGTGYLPGGIGWYRKHFNYSPSEKEGKKTYIYFEGVYNRSDVYINGQHLGHRPSGYNSFMYDLTPYLKEGDNVISVRADHSRYADSRYYTGSGIYRDVYLVEAPETHIEQWGIGFETVAVNNGTASIKIHIGVENPIKGLKLKTDLINAEGKTVATSTKNAFATNTIEMKVKNAHFWSIEDPYLYTLRTELLENGIRTDGSDIQVGIRTLHFDPNTGFALNGKNMKVKGVCIHHDAGALGAVVPEEVWERRLRNLKDLGVNALRMSHNPQAPIVYDLADRIGFLIMDEASDEWEFPKRKWVEGWNVGQPGFDGTADFFEEWIDRDVADMVRRDRNHPSVFLWSIGNEVDYPNDPYSHPILDEIGKDDSGFTQANYGGYDPNAPDAMRIGEIAKRLNAVVKSIDTSRPTTGALAGVIMSNETAYPDAVDIVGYNYTEDRYDLDHAKYPDRVIYGSENRSDYKAWKDARDRDFIFGQFIWTGLDYLGESGKWPSRGMFTGLLDLKGDAKPRGMFRKALWSDQPFTYIGTHPYTDRMKQFSRWLSTDAPDVWNYNEGDTIRVLAYTNAPQARLLLNGKQIGEVKPFDDETGIIHWEIPFVPGTLIAQGLNDSGEVESSYTIQTTGRPYALRISSDKNEFTAPGQTAHIFIEVVDENGNLVKQADNNITVRVSGNAKLLALENGDNSDMGNFHDNVQRVHNGKLLGYLRSIDPTKEPKQKQIRRPSFDFDTASPTDPSEVTIRVSSPLLKPATLIIKQD